MGVLVPVRAQVAKLFIPSALPARWATTCFRVQPGSPEGSAAQASEGSMAAMSAASLAASAARSVRGVADMASTLPAGIGGDLSGRDCRTPWLGWPEVPSVIVRSPRVESIDHTFYERAR